TLPKFESDLKKFFHRSVPVWITEYGHETKPGEPHGVTPAKQAAYAKQALTIAKNDPNVQMFVWFVVHDSQGNPWLSGLYGTRDNKKPAYTTFSATARLIDGTMSNVKAGPRPKVKVYVPYLGYYSAPGTQIGLTYAVRDTTAKKNVTVGWPVPALARDFAIPFTGNFSPVKKHVYSITVNANEPNGHSETQFSQVT